MTMTDPTSKTNSVEEGALAAKRVAKTPRPKRSTRSAVSAVATLAGAATIAAFGGLWLQMAQGNDPVLASGTAATSKQRVIKKIVVVEKVVPSTGYSSAGSSYGYTGSSGSVSPGSSAAPVAVAPAPAPAPVVSQPS
jgi:hypothetical protein